MCLRGQGRREEARSEFELALAGRERVLGPDHPHTEESRAALADS
ncbi:tetratricopeptide repeat protein [Marinactinospora thermotolerans]